MVGFFCLRMKRPDSQTHEKDECEQPLDRGKSATLAGLKFAPAGGTEGRAGGEGGAA